MTDFATQVEELTARAATAHGLGQTDNARTMTHAACALVAEADSEYVTRGQSLEDLVKLYGSGVAD